MKFKIFDINDRIFIVEFLRHFNRAFIPLLTLKIFYVSEKIINIAIALLISGTFIVSFFKAYFSKNEVLKAQYLIKIRIIEFILLCLTILICYAIKQRIICLIIILTIIIFDTIMDWYFSHKIHKKQNIKNMLK